MGIFRSVSTKPKAGSRRFAMPWDDGFFRERKSKPVPQFVNAPRMGLCWLPQSPREALFFLLKSAADDVQFITGVDDRGIEDVNRFLRGRPGGGEPDN